MPTIIDLTGRFGRYAWDKRRGNKYWMVGDSCSFENPDDEGLLSGVVSELIQENESPEVCAYCEFQEDCGECEEQPVFYAIVCVHVGDADTGDDMTQLGYKVPVNVLQECDSSLVHSKRE